MVKQNEVFERKEINGNIDQCVHQQLFGVSVIAHRNCTTNL